MKTRTVQKVVAYNATFAAWGGCQEIRRYPADLSFSSFPRKREPRDFSNLPWAPTFAGRRFEGAADLIQPLGWARALVPSS